MGINFITNKLFVYQTIFATFSFFNDVIRKVSVSLIHGLTNKHRRNDESQKN